MTATDHIKSADLRNLISDLQADIRTARTEFLDLTPEQLNHHPDHDQKRWCIGQCLAHLIKSFEAYKPAVAEAVRKAPDTDGRPLRHGFWGRLIIKYTRPDGPKMKTIKVFKPDPMTFHADVVADYIDMTEQLIDFIRRADGRDLNRTFKHPFIPLLRLRLGDMLTFMTLHSRRHLLQAGRVKQDRNFSE